MVASVGDSFRGNPNYCVSIPFIAGQWSLLMALLLGCSCSLSSQSPSLRGSGRFIPLTQDFVGLSTGLNPLHCGAVVASGPCQLNHSPLCPVSIPFIAGQWSLLWRAPDGSVAAILVSIPFIAGQWSLLFCRLARSAGSLVSQSPSLRGSGRFTCQATCQRAIPSLNPLHCGAVVASNN